MSTKIISAFPLTGKTFYNKNHKLISLDLDSSDFSIKFVNGKFEQNEDYPKNYIQLIKDNIGKYKYIFVSSSEEVRSALLNECIFFYSMFPLKSDKDIYVKRILDNNHDINYIEQFFAKWDKMIDCLNEYHSGCSNIVMETKTTISDYLVHY